MTAPVKSSTIRRKGSTTRRRFVDRRRRFVDPLFRSSTIRRKLAIDDSSDPISHRRRFVDTWQSTIRRPLFQIVDDSSKIVDDSSKIVENRRNR